MNEKRRSDRKSAGGIILVTDVMTEHALGRIGNLSESGMMLIAPRPLANDSLYQLRFELPAIGGDPRHVLEIGVHEQWTEEAVVPGQFWSGLRFISLGEDDAEALKRWLAHG